MKQLNLLEVTNMSDQNSESNPSPNGNKEGFVYPKTATTPALKRAFKKRLKQEGGDHPLATQMFDLWYEKKGKDVEKVANDPTVKILHHILDEYEKANPKELKLGPKGYSIKRSKGRNIVTPFVITKITK
jgi:hypothetical protein